jgi:hypothetical protein
MDASPKNYYEVIPSYFKKKYHNPKYKKHGIKIPFRGLIVGGTGAGKTNLLMEILHRMNGTFENIVVCCKSKAEPLYEYLEEKGITFFEGSDEIPDISEFEDCGQTLIVFDDLVLEKDQSRIKEYFIRGRKMGEGISCCYLTQSYFSTPKVIRQQCNYIFLKKLGSVRDLKLILSEFTLGVSIEELAAMYAASTQNKEDFFMIDTEACPDGGDGVGKFRHNFQTFAV